MTAQTAIRPAVLERDIPVLGPVTAVVSQGDPELVARLLDTTRQITTAEWAVIEGGVK